MDTTPHTSATPFAGVYCALCHKELPPAGPVADFEVRKLGEFEYFELAHVPCAQADGTVGWLWDDEDD